MTAYFLTAASYSLMCIIGCMFVAGENFKIEKEKVRLWLALILLVGFGLRMWYGLQDNAFWVDIKCFKSWADATAYYGLGGMYHSDMFLDYPPGYMYVLWLTNIIQDVFSLDYNSVVYTFIIKIPPMIADLAGAYFVYAAAKEKMGEKWGVLLCACYTFCPALVYNSSVWGQIDSLYTLLIVMALYFISKDEVIKASVVYALALITKPQALLFGPVLLFWVISKKNAKILFRAVGTGLGCMYLLALPFSQSLNPLWLVNLYKNTFNGYRYFTVNGYNTYMRADLNWKSLDSVPMAGYINVAVILLCFAFCMWAYFATKGKEKIFTTSLMFITVFFSFCTMMHERYMHPAILLAMMAFIYTKEKLYFGLFLLTAAANYLNVSASLLTQYAGLSVTKSVYIPVSVMAVTAAVTAVYAVSYKAIRDKAFSFKKLPSGYGIAVLCAVYAMLAFFRLGATTAPQTFWQANKKGDWLVYRFEQPATVNAIWTYSGMGDEHSPQDRSAVKIGGDFEVLMANSKGVWEHIADTHHDYVFTWSKLDTEFHTSSVWIRAKSDNQVLNEIIFTDKNGEVIKGRVESDKNADFGLYTPENAFDEREMLPTGEDAYYWSMYFDEIYHGRTAYEQLKGYSIYETTHPPLGKILISIGIALFGMTPFGWRCVGAGCGVLMVYIMYLLAKELFGSEKTALFTAFVFSFDFMHYTQTRISTVDSYVVLFVMLMFLYMIRWAKIPLADKGTKAYFNLFMSGLFMGCAVSVKWNGAYSALGLAVYFFTGLWFKYKDYSAHSKDGVKKAFTVCLWCVVFFVVVPLVIYFASFGAVLETDSFRQTVTEFISYQQHMFNYHSKLVAEHFFASLWYTWPFIIKPMWYSISRFGSMSSSISAFGNPAVWLVMIPALLFMTYDCYRQKDRSAFAVLTGYLGSFLPWIAITRLSFIYHYFPATIFGVLATGYVINRLLKTQKGTKAVYLYMAAVVVLFVVFFPVISGVPASASYLDSLELLGTWYFN